MSSLLSEQKTPLVPPTTYIPIWVPVNSPAEKIARAKEELNTDSNVNKIDDVVTAAKPVAP